MFKKLKFALFFMIMVLSQSSQAIVNIEKVNIEKNPKNFQGEVDFKLSGASGNSENNASSLGSRFQWNEVSTQFIVLKYNYAKSFGVKSKDNAFMHYRYIINPKLITTTEYFFQVEDNEFKQLNLRTLVGGGFRFRLFEYADNYHGRLGVGVFHSREEISDVLGTIEEVGRMNIYFTFQYKIKEGLSITSTSYYQPSLDDLSDYRMLEQLGLEFNVTKDFLYYVTLDVSFDSKPVNGLDKNDTSYKSGIKYRF